MDNSVDLPGYKHYVDPDGDRPDLMVCYLDIAERDGAVVNGVALRVGADELPALDERERNYERREVTGPARRRPRRTRLGLRRAGAPGARGPGAGAASGAWPSRAATTSACWPASTCCASGGASRCSPSRPTCRSRTSRSSTTRRWPCRAAHAEPSMRLIDLFEVAPEADEAFLADWESERVAGGVLYRALREDVDFRFVAVAPDDGRGVSTRSSTRRARPTGPRASRSSTPSRSPRARTSASSPAGSAPARRSPTSAATSGRACTAASGDATSASSTSRAGRAR